jgi:very-short-patch-repair endonuclease
MGARFTGTIPEQAVSDYKFGISAFTVSQRYKIPYVTFRNLLKSRGIPLRNLSESAVARQIQNLSKPRLGNLEKLGILNDSVVDMYKSGKSALEISQELKVSRESLTRFLRRKLGDLRTIRQAQELRMQRTTKEQRKQMTSAAHDAVRGIKFTEHRLVRRAQAKQSKNKMTEKEISYFQGFKKAGLSLVSQYAIGKYNVDFACPKARVAVEIDTAWSTWTPGKKFKKQTEKESALNQMGWRCIFLVSSASNRGRQYVVDDFLDCVAIIKDRRRRAGKPLLSL